MSKEPERFRFAGKRAREDELGTPRKSPRKMVDCAVQTDPAATESMEDEPPASQETERLRKVMANVARMIELRKEERKLRESLMI